MYHRSLLGLGNSSATQPIQHTHPSTADGVSNAFETIWEGQCSGVWQAPKFCNNIEVAAEQSCRPRCLLVNMHGGEHTRYYFRLNAWRCLLPIQRLYQSRYTRKSRRAPPVSYPPGQARITLSSQAAKRSVHSSDSTLLQSSAS